MLAVLTGTTPTDAARATHLHPDDLADAAERYRRAGQHALHHHRRPGWWQINIEFTDWAGAETVFAHHIAPLLDHTTDDPGPQWWFMRKHPCWRVRIPRRPGTAGHAPHHLTAGLDALVAEHLITDWRPAVYEPETTAFGGNTGMSIAHDLFCTDSRAITDLIRHHHIDLGRRELSVLLCTALIRAAGAERYEQGDTWHRVARERPLPTDVPAAKLTDLAHDLRHVIHADLSPDGPLLTEEGPLAAVASWVDGFRAAGHRLGSAARTGTLERGQRDILSYLIIFHWNRLGLPTRSQSILAAAASTAIFDERTSSTTL
ncbi:thiopeptide-type bacteriocin biosynthesis protein [Actinosynnema sp. NPDC050436]|uniref:thiopeptide-type bacteriocin biosynthesis protein n=1 Tax=Actinosynnema sp. NPDC050436 TaxID=3155659 RepID=UPI0033F93FC4